MLPNSTLNKKETNIPVQSSHIPLQGEDLTYLICGKTNFHLTSNVAKVYQLLNEQTIEANRIQSYRNAAQKELSECIRFSSNDAEK